MNREAIFSAVLDLLTQGAGRSFPTIGDRVIPWTECSEQPALFLRPVADHYAPRKATGLPQAVTIEAEIWLYNRSDDPETPPVRGLNDLIDAVEAALAPPTPGFSQTLGGLVANVAVGRAIDKSPGDLDSQAIALIPLSILVPY
jgi:hypothetical protein